MSSGGALNPASQPFFPDAIRSNDDDSASSNRGHFGPRTLAIRPRDQSSSSLAMSDYRSAGSSPSPPSMDSNTSSRGVRFQSSPGPIPTSGAATDRPTSRQSTVIQRVDADRPYPNYQVSREASLAAIYGMTDDGMQASVVDRRDSYAAPSLVQAFQDFRIQSAREQQPTPPVPQALSRLPSFNNNGPFAMSGSPTSSMGSGSQYTTDQGPTSDAQLRGHPTIQEILDRLARCELSTRDIQGQLRDIHAKVDILVERALANSNSNNNNSLNHSNSQRPEFKDPFAPASATNFSSGSLANIRASIGGNIAPNQTPAFEDMTQISQRLNDLTSSVGQLLALQTQQGPSPANQLPQRRPSQAHLDPNTISPSKLVNLGNGLPMRPETRAASVARISPARTWSVGTLELPQRPIDNGGNSNMSMRGMDTRRSVSGLSRRDSSVIQESPNEIWNSSRDNASAILRWEQLPLAPELLASLNRFGVGPPNKIQQRALPFLLKGADIIAQAPPTQERIAAYVIPAIQVAWTASLVRSNIKGPLVLMISTTVDQATQAQRMIRDIGGPIGIRSALGVGVTSPNSDLSVELRLLQQGNPHIICGTPQKLHALFTTTQGGISGQEVKLLILDEVDQLIARNLQDYVLNIVKLLPSSSRPQSTTGLPPGSNGNGASNTFDPNGNGLPNPSGRRFSTFSESPSPFQQMDRQTALFSNTVPQDVLNLASHIQVREVVRVLVRRDGNTSNTAEVSQNSSRGLRQFYLYLALTSNVVVRSESFSSPTGGGVGGAAGGLGIIGSGRGSVSTESIQARESKLDALADLFSDLDQALTQAIVYVGGANALEAVVYKLASAGLEAMPLHGEMNVSSRMATVNRFKNASQSSVVLKQPVTKVLVVYEVPVKTSEVSQVPLVINYDLPKTVEDYAPRVAPAVASNYSRPGVVVNFVTATGGDVEMLRSIECYYKIKCPEVPSSLRELI